MEHLHFRLDPDHCFARGLDPDPGPGDLAGLLLRGAALGLPRRCLGAEPEVDTAPYFSPP